MAQPQESSQPLNPARNTKNLDFLNALGNTGKAPVATPKPAEKFDSASYDNNDSPRDLLQDGEKNF